ncbi:MULTISPECIES: response regulator transcription factor [unclassified Paenibacillus]|uniref:response regulator transcription factor n=1 Tax=unclassified Paenibacillus TaxID=185978 RepID=UPI0003E21A6D|nr:MULTISPECIES: response regulator transcription factor [unclassified Paenibacillus]ETT38147.1 two component transcriptional regulator, winged helix family protein [Paenibacillus sp. FSL R7-269]OMF88317.1 DNA-binding response regulator [Paenibacillus sp. FSL R7-0337]
MKTLLIVEDDQSLNKGIALSLAHNELHIEQAYSLTMADQIISSTQIDLILLDVNLPDGSGLDYCERIRGASQVPIIFLTANDMEPDIVTGFALGADDYITKPFSLMILRARVMAVLRRSDALTHERIVVGLLEFDFGKMEYFKNGRPLLLSKSEQKLLRILVTNRGNILTREQLIDRTWSQEAVFVDENALTVAIKRLRAKIEEEPSSPQYIKTVYGLGYTWTEGPVL